MQIKRRCGLNKSKNEIHKVLFIKNTFLQSDIESLHNAAQSGDLSKVKELIGKNKRLIYSRDASGASALHKAAKDGHIEVVKHILSENPESAKVTDDVS